MTSNGEQREFYSSPDLKLPKGVVVDKNGCVYVDGYISYNARLNGRSLNV
jgi:hypothetical protein